MKTTYTTVVSNSGKLLDVPTSEVSRYGKVSTSNCVVDDKGKWVYVGQYCHVRYQ
jgi:hypothetical protein